MWTAACDKITLEDDLKKKVADQFRLPVLKELQNEKSKAVSAVQSYFLYMVWIAILREDPELF